MNIRKAAYLIIGIPLFLHVLVYACSTPFAKPFLEERLSALLKCDFRMDKAEVFLLTRSVHLTNPRLVMDWEGQKQDLIRARKMKITMRLLPLIQKRLIVQNVVLHTPAITLTRSAAGEINLRSFFNKIVNTGQAAAPVQTDAVAAESGRALKIYLQKVYIKGGEVTFTDNRQQPPVVLSLGDIKFFTVFTYDYEKELLDSIKIKLNSVIRSDQPSTLKIDGEIDPTPDYIGSTFRLNAYIDNFDVTTIWPYIDVYLPLTLHTGRISVESHLNCVGGNFETSKQTVRIQSLRIREWKQDFSGKNTMGISNQSIIGLIERNCKAISFDFYVSGSLKDLKVSPGEMMLKMVGDTLLNKTADTNKE